MSVRGVWRYPNARLSQVARAVAPTEFGTEALYELAQDLTDTMAAHKAAGVAATQLDFPWTETFESDTPPAVFAVVGLGGQTIVCCNPSVVEVLQRKLSEEGCLSFPGVTEILEGPSVARVRYHTPDGGEPVEEFLNMLTARAFAHELEHLRGRVLTERMSGLQRRGFLKRHAKATGNWRVA